MNRSDNPYTSTDLPDVGPARYSAPQKNQITGFLICYRYWMILIGKISCRKLSIFKYPEAEDRIDKKAWFFGRLSGPSLINRIISQCLNFLSKLFLLSSCRESRDRYVRGAEVKVKINSLELSQKFLGYEREMTLLEADCTLLGLNSS